MTPASSPPTATAASREDFARRHLRWNVLTLGTDVVLYVTGLAFVSQATILPAFAEYLGAPNVAIGAIPAVATLGWLLPALFAAGHTESLARKLPFVLRYTVWERAPYLALAAVALAAPHTPLAVSVGLLLLALFAASASSGALMPAWLDVVAKTIPVTLRGRFTAGYNTVGSLGRLAASVAATAILGAVGAPGGYALCFLAGGAFMMVSWGALAMVLEPPPSAPPPPAVPLRAYLRRIPGLLQRNRNMSWYLAARACAIVGSMAGAFFTVYALRDLGAPASRVGLYTAMLFLGELAGGLALGWLADRLGHRIALAGGAACMAAANLVALSAPSLDVLAVAFLLAGISDATVQVSGMNFLLEMAPTAEERPTYVGLGRTAVAPVAFAAPLAAGALADAAGYAVVFACAGAGSLLALLLLTSRVRDPRGRVVDSVILTL